jgi:arginyl-tRNA--protein-N-Asp/Glu arginylyltransferase
MKLLFSEAKSDYGNYIFPYAVWAFPESGETPSQILARGFLPSSYALDRFYMCRHIRVALPEFTPSSENRRILRKGEGIESRIVPRAEFEFTEKRRAFCKAYADEKFKPAGMSLERLDALMNSKSLRMCSSSRTERRRRKLGLSCLYVEEKTAAFYYYAFYDLAYYARNLGMFMMTAAVATLAAAGLKHIYLGTCYSDNALYKFQFAGAEFFNGFAWSAMPKSFVTWWNASNRQSPSTCWRHWRIAKNFGRLTCSRFVEQSPFRID